MIKVRFKRVKVGVYFHPSEWDQRFAEGTLAAMPKKGEGMVFYPKRLHNDWWMTSTVTRVKKLKTLLSVQTRNSTYHVKKGWTK